MALSDYAGNRQGKSKDCSQYDYNKTEVLCPQNRGKKAGGRLSAVNRCPWKQAWFGGHLHDDGYDGSKIVSFQHCCDIALRPV